MILTVIHPGEFGLVFKAHLKWHRSAETEIVAVKTMKGICMNNQRTASSYKKIGLDVM